MRNCLASRLTYLESIWNSVFITSCDWDISQTLTVCWKHLAIKSWLLTCLAQPVTRWPALWRPKCLLKLSSPKLLKFRQSSYQPKPEISPAHSHSFPILLSFQKCIWIDCFFMDSWTLLLSQPLKPWNSTDSNCFWVLTVDLVLNWAKGILEVFFFCMLPWTWLLRSFL